MKIRLIILQLIVLFQKLSYPNKRSITGILKVFYSERVIHVILVIHSWFSL